MEERATREDIWGSGKGGVERGKLEMVWYDLVGVGMVRCGMVWYDVI